jgi:hypothetical protein
VSETYVTHCDIEDWYACRCKRQRNGERGTGSVNDISQHFRCFQWTFPPVVKIFASIAAAPPPRIDNATVAILPERSGNRRRFLQCLSLSQFQDVKCIMVAGPTAKCQFVLVSRKILSSRCWLFGRDEMFALHY